MKEKKTPLLSSIYNLIQWHKNDQQQQAVSPNYLGSAMAYR